VKALGWVVRSVAVVGAVGLAALLLWPDGEAVRQLILRIYLFGLHRGVPARFGPEFYAAVLNVLVFIPIAWAGVVLLGRRALVVALAIFALSAIVELVQALPLLWRHPSLMDVVCNSLGGMIGAFLGSATLQWRRRTRSSD
jgi:glycopeptide antibiotics resistance protein